jgi:hypothetical protein
MTQCSGSSTIMTQQGNEIFASQCYVISVMKCIAVYGYQHPGNGGSRFLQNIDNPLPSFKTSQETTVVQ